MSPREVECVHPRGRDARVSVSLELPCRPDSPAAARREMARLEPELGHALLTRVRVVVTEMVSTCVWNGGGGTVAVEVTARTDTVRGEVTELGPKTDPTSSDPSPSPRGGFGLLLVRRLADRTGAMAERRGMWFEIDRSDDR